jgi:hypothetical protein
MPTATQITPTSKTMLWAGRIISALPVLLMVFFGAFGLLNRAAVAPGFAHYGYPEGDLVPICIVEIICAIIYAIPQTSVFGAILLTGYLGGATSTHVRAGEPFYFPIIVGILVWLGLFLRDARLRALVPLKS